MHAFKLAVFDMAGTTVEEGGSVYRVLRKSVQEAGYEVPDDQLIKIAGMSKYEAVRYLLPEHLSDDLMLVDKIFSSFQNKLNHIYLEDPSVQEKQGISGLFSFLRHLNIIVAINTGYSRTQADILIHRLGWGSRIDLSITSDEVERGRPYPDMIKALMTKTAITNSRQIIKVGDTVNDILEGKNAHCGLVVGVLGGAHRKSQLQEAGADLILKETSDLQWFFKN